MTTYPATFCPTCGTALTARRYDGRERRYCPACERFVWHNPVPGAGVSVVDDDRILLVERARPPGVGEWTIPGGHMEADEQPAEAAVRELEEETGLRVDPGDLRLVGVKTLDPFDEKSVVSVGYVVDRDATSGTVAAGDDAAAARFWRPDELESSEETLRSYFRERVRRSIAVVRGSGDLPR